VCSPVACRAPVSQCRNRLFARVEPAGGDAIEFGLEDDTVIVPAAAEVIALRRRGSRTDIDIALTFA
jgi:hypothetical protein